MCTITALYSFYFLCHRLANSFGISHYNVICLMSNYVIKIEESFKNN